MQLTAWSNDLRVTGDGSGVASRAGMVLLRLLADRVGLTGALSTALARRRFFPVHDRGRVLTDVAVMIADGGEAIADIDVLLRHQDAVLGPVAAPATVWRTLDALDELALRKIPRARRGPARTCGRSCRRCPPRAPTAAIRHQGLLVTFGSRACAGCDRIRAYDVTFACWSAYPFGGFLAVLLLAAVAWYRAGRPRPA